MIDIADSESLRAYLVQNKVFNDEKNIRIKYFPGGVSGTVAFVSSNGVDVIVKQALPFLKVAERWECDPSRMKIEHLAMQTYGKYVPESVPACISFDDDNFIMIREAVPEHWGMWKTHLLAGLLDFRIAEKAAQSLLTVHKQNAGDPKAIITFGDKAVFYNLRINPYIEKVLQKHPALAPKGQRVIKMLMEGAIALVHGDYSPKNILVDNDKLSILDMEVAHYGHPAFDLAFFTNHFLLKTIKNPQWKGATLNMLQCMLDLYLPGVAFMPKEVMEQQTVEVLAFLLLARVDGKSPAEYLQSDAEKQKVRDLAFAILEQPRPAFDFVIAAANNIA
jgi:hypothetical protein